jgi:hypothetical protein
VVAPEAPRVVGVSEGQLLERWPQRAPLEFAVLLPMARARAYGARSRLRLLRRSAHARGAREGLTGRRLRGVGEYRLATPRGWLSKSIIYMVKLVMYTYIYIYIYIYMLIYAYICLYMLIYADGDLA